MQDASHTTTNREWQGADCKGSPQVICLHAGYAGAEPVLTCLGIQVHVPCRHCRHLHLALMRVSFPPNLPMLLSAWSGLVEHAAAASYTTEHVDSTLLKTAGLDWNW